MITKPVIVSGITATGKLTIGNYIGAIKPIVQMQDKHQMYIFVADLHALTSEIDAKELRQNRRDIMALFIACGINPQKTVLFFQSDVQEHGMMNWIFENHTTLGELSRMTQFKDKSKVREANGTEKIVTGLLTYPVLMAGDILLYNPDIVPVGADQKQHIELTRNIALRFNNKYGETFKIPEFFTPNIGSKITSLQDPTKKMSKSDSNEKASIYLLDTPETAKTKISKAVTDSDGKIFLSDKKPGIKNLLTIYSVLKDVSLEEACKEFENKNYGELKIAVGSEVAVFLNIIQEKYYKVINEIDTIASNGATKATEVAKETLKKIKTKIGLL